MTQGGWKKIHTSTNTHKRPTTMNDNDKSYRQINNKN